MRLVVTDDSRALDALGAFSGSGEESWELRNIGVWEPHDAGDVKIYFISSVHPPYLRQ